MLAATHAAQPPPGLFEPSCASSNDYGWPRFNNISALRADKPWATYLQAVYGALPTEFPVCIYDLWKLDSQQYIASGLNASGLPVHDAHDKNLKNGDLFGDYVGGGLQIYHEKWTPAANHTWVEVSHRVYPTELEGMWVWRQRGSGIFANVGRTIVFPTPSNPADIHKTAIEFLTANCSKRPSVEWPQLESDIFGFCAREKGYDSIQFEPQVCTHAAIGNLASRRVPLSHHKWPAVPRCRRTVRCPWAPSTRRD